MDPKRFVFSMVFCLMAAPAWAEEPKRGSPPGADLPAPPAAPAAQAREPRQSTAQPSANVQGSTDGSPARVQAPGTVPVQAHTDAAPASTTPAATSSADDEMPEGRKKGLMIGGLATLGGTYVFTALVGLYMLSGTTTQPGQTCLNCDTVGPRLLIPIAGPWLALPDANGDGGKAVAAALGIAQGIGLTLSIVGIAQFASTGPKQSEPKVARLRAIQVLPTRGGAYGVLNFTL